MEKYKLVLVSFDEDYITLVAMEFARRLGDVFDIEVIFEPTYYTKFFLKAQRIDILIIEEKLFTNDLLKQGINQLFLLTEIERVSEHEYTNIYKYSNILDIYNRVMKNFKLDNTVSVKATKTQVVLCYSPIGGSGKTHISLGLAKCLNERYKRALYINAEAIQSFSSLMDTQEKTSFSFEEINGGLPFECVKSKIRKKEIDFLPQFATAQIALNYNHNICKLLIENKANLKEYDFIIIDTDSSLTYSKIELLELADRVIIPVEADWYSMNKLKEFMKIIDCSNSEKFFFLGNKYKKIDEENFDSKESINYVGYIEEMDDRKISLSDFCQNNVIKGLTQLLL